MRLRPILLTILLVCLSQTAFAQSTVVLGLRSVEGDDELALALTSELRREAGAVADWNVGSQAVSLSQMVLVHGCDETDEPCLSRIAGGLGVQQLIYGTMSHGSVDDDYRYEVEVSLFDKEKMAITKQSSLAFDQSQASGDALGRVAERLITGIAPPAATGTLVVSSNVEGALVAVDGRNVGPISGGSVEVGNLSPGSHQVRLQAIGYESATELVDLTAGETSRLDVPLAPEAVATTGTERQWDVGVSASSGTLSSTDTGVPNWLPYTLLGFSVVNVGGVVASWMIIRGVENDDNYKRYSGLVYEQNQLLPESARADDVCAQAASGQTYSGLISSSDVKSVSSQCDKADTFETLQYVFGGVAAASLLGSIILFAVDDDEEAPSHALKLEPMLGGRMNGVRATVHF